VLGWGMRLVRCIPVVRGDREANAQVAVTLQRNIAQGYSYCVFPEGTRTSNGSLGELRKGIFHRVKECPVPIVPVTIDGAFAVMPKSRSVRAGGGVEGAARGAGFWPGTIRLVVHPTITAEEVAALQVEQLVERVRTDLAAGLDR